MLYFKLKTGCELDLTKAKDVKVLARYLQAYRMGGLTPENVKRLPAYLDFHVTGSSPLQYPQSKFKDLFFLGDLLLGYERKLVQFGTKAYLLCAYGLMHVVLDYARVDSIEDWACMKATDGSYIHTRRDERKYGMLTAAFWFHGNRPDTTGFLFIYGTKPSRIVYSDKIPQSMYLKGSFDYFE